MVTAADFEPGKFWAATKYGPRELEGHVGAGLALGTSKDPGRFVLYHVGSGHIICLLGGPLMTALMAAAEIGNIVPWDMFEDPAGYQNMEPDLPEKVRALAARFRIEPATAGDGDREQAHAVQRAREENHG